MKIPFFQQLQSWAGQPVQQVVVATNGPARAGIERVLRHVLAELPEVLATAVVDVASGQLLASYAASREFRPGAVAGPNAEVVRQLGALLADGPPGTPPEALEEVLVTLRSQLHLLRLLPQGQQFLYVAVDCRDTNLGIAREVMRSGLERLNEAPG
ncbi:hypothetical protein [Hymenobacter nivis]|uniref:Roadblock/LAMTOR2 domain-containing protein n=1 Tax=Hymenobacter nivis TaxID=1850093 RepID=A0A502GU27_9BACT|nr:hypothetical protein [Hymenobacter nivis]TPG65431.1 hypothetical protein EAH73_13235 [Hymenobacter nivis]